MIDVTCFCGRSYSFTGDEGTCPECHERVSLTGRPAAEVRQMDDQLGGRTSQTDESPSQELAA
jgi:hypothetical protein